MKKKTKEINAWDVLGLLWGKWKSMLNEDIEPYKSLSWKDLVNMVSPTETESFVKEMALEKFLFELQFVYRQPSYKSMKYLWGEHAMLYDVWACYEHRFVIVTHDDHQMIQGQTVFCPHCNHDNFLNEEKMNEYIQFVGGRTDSVDMWKQTLKFAKIHRKIRREMNIRYWFRKWTEKGYIGYRVMSFVKSLFASA